MDQQAQGDKVPNDGAAANIGKRPPTQISGAVTGSGAGAGGGGGPEDYDSDAVGGGGAIRREGETPAPGTGGDAPSHGSR